MQFILYAILGPETRYIRKGVQHTGSPFKQEYFTFRRIDPTPLSWFDFIQPLTFFRYACVTIPAVAYSMIFLFGSVMLTVEVPQLFGAKFHFNTQQLGLQFIAMIIGSVIGEQIGGFSSDRWMAYRRKKIATSPEPEFRLWLSYIGHICTIVGVVVFLVQIQRAPPLKWNVTPLIGAAIASAGNQIVSDPKPDLVDLLIVPPGHHNDGHLCCGLLSRRSGQRWRLYHVCEADLGFHRAILVSDGRKLLVFSVRTDK